MQPDEDLAIALTTAIGVLDRAIQAGQPDDVSVSEMAVLAHISGTPSLGPVELAGLLNMKAPSVTRHIKSLTDRGLIEMAQHPDDGRRRQASVTNLGGIALEQAARRTWLTSRIAGLGPAQRDILAGTVKILEQLSR